MKTQITKQHTNAMAVQQPTTFHKHDRMKRRNMWKFLVPTVMALAFSCNAFAAEAYIGPVKIERLGIIATATQGHIAGNMEIKILGGFVIPPGLQCTDSYYITTRKTTDPDRAMFYLLLKGKTTPPTAAEPETFQMLITDNPALTAFPGRCSLEYVDLI